LNHRTESEKSFRKKVLSVERFYRSGQEFGKEETLGMIGIPGLVKKKRKGRRMK
jgi:hypothetical protein